MDQELLVDEQIAAGEDFAREFNDAFAIAASFWINPTDSDEWYLYIASPDISDANTRDAYGEVLRRLGARGNQWLDPYHVKLLNSADPLAVKVVEIRDHYPLRMSTRFNGTSIAGTAISGAYIYPPVAAASSTP